MENNLEKCLAYLNIKKLPESSIEEYNTRAIVQVTKADGNKYFCVGIFRNGRTVIIKDFDKKNYGVRSVDAVFPVKEVAVKFEKKIDLNSMSLKDLRILLDNENIPNTIKDKKDDLINAYLRHHAED